MLLVAYLLLGLAVFVGDGTRPGVPLAVASTALLFWSATRGGRLWTRGLPWLIAVGATFACAGISARRPLGQFIGVVTVLQALLGLAACVRPRLAGRAMLCGAVALYAAAGALTLASSPSPKIDVFHLQQGGARALEAGENPYAATFPNLYNREQTLAFFGDDRTELREYPYPPLSLLATTLGHRVGGDVRWTLLAAQMGIGLLVFALARGSGHGASVAIALATLHFLHPRGLYLLKLSWTDSLMACAFLAVLLAVQRRRTRWLGVMLSLFVGLKQYSIVALPLLFRSGRVPRRAMVEGLAIAGAIALPFFLWGPADFINDVVRFQLRQPFRADALSIPAVLFQYTGWRAPGALALVGGGAAVAWAWPRLGSAAPPSSLPGAVALAYACFFLFAKQAFCNYYYFVAVVILAAAAVQDPTDPTEPAAEIPRTPGGVRLAPSNARENIHR